MLSNNTIIRYESVVIQLSNVLNEKQFIFKFIVSQIYSPLGI